MVTIEASRCPLSVNVSDLGPVILNELVKRSTREVFYDFITKYTEIFVEENERSAFALQKLLTFFQQKLLAYLGNYLLKI